jgi:tetratricopeptide (TPR) repeat protein
VQQLVDAMAEDPGNIRSVREAVNELESSEDRSPAAAVRLGVCYLLLGRYQQAVDTLKKGDGGALAHFYLAKSHFSKHNHQQAAESYQSAAKAGYNADACALGRAEALHSGLAKRYDGEPFVHVLPFGQTPATRHVRGSNHCLIGVVADRQPGRAIVISVLDNLVKGASGQAIQNLNLMLGYPETSGLEQLPLFP